MHKNHTMYEFKYKPPEFYTQYFNDHPDFKVLESFHLSEDEDEKNLLIGKVEFLNTIHPLELRVEIPVSFPHHKLTFRTKSLSGYPHLIHTGKIQYGDWFCLNTPFAESAKDQLDQEIFRLKEWIHRQMKEELPPIIEDNKLKEAIFLNSIPEWMNPDEIKEISAKAKLTFIGTFADSTDNFTENLGFFNCIQTPDKRFYAFKEKYDFTTHKLPYVIVDVPDDWEAIDDFITLKEYYNWDENICKHLLPTYNVGKPYHVWHSLESGINLDEESCLQQLEAIREELVKEESYLLPRFQFLKDKNKKRIQNSHKNLILEEIDIIEKKVRTEHGIKTRRDRNSVDEDEWTDEDWEEEAKQSYHFDWGQYIYDFFTLGFKIDSEILWMIFYTNNASLRSNQEGYNIEFADIHIQRATSLILDRSLTQTIDESMFFGRGALCENLLHKNVALIGLGAIGSMVAEALAHSGILHIGLWDSDVVEPGNICRSTYRLPDLGESKVQAIAKKLRYINPFINVGDIKPSGEWSKWGAQYNPNDLEYKNGSFYDNINYTNQEDAVKTLQDYDLIIDCTGRNEILHFLSYAFTDKDVVSMAITNKANELLCMSNRNGNPFELRKAYLSAIAQDTKDFYVEGSGCYEPTFRASYFDVCSLVNLCIKELNLSMSNGSAMDSVIFRCSSNGIIADKIHTYCLEDSDILLNIPHETFLDAEDLPESLSDYIGFILGSYSKDGKQIMVTNIIEPEYAEEILNNIFETSRGIIDYIGDVAYSGSEQDSIRQESIEDIAAKAVDPDINTNNPLLAIRNPEGDFSFFLYINGSLIPFHRI